MIKIGITTSATTPQGTPEPLLLFPGGTKAAPEVFSKVPPKPRTVPFKSEIGMSPEIVPALNDVAILPQCMPFITAVVGQEQRVRVKIFNFCAGEMNGNPGSPEIIVQKPDIQKFDGRFPRSAFDLPFRKADIIQTVRNVFTNNYRAAAVDTV